MKQRCPLVVRFGKDIASLISWWVWKLNIKNVINEYNTYVDPDDDDCNYGIWWWSDEMGFTFNFRQIHSLGMIKTLRGDTSTGHQIPKNYWTIKELY